MFAVCTLPGSVLGVLLADKVSRPGFDAIMGLALTALAWWLVRGRRRKPHPHGSAGRRG